MLKLKKINLQEMSEAQSNCYDVGGRLLCAAENLQHLIKNKNQIPLQNPIFDFYNTFKFANSNDPEELLSLLIEHMKTYGNMKNRYQKQFEEELILPIDKFKIKNYFKLWRNGLQDNYITKLYEALEKLLIEKDSNDYKSFITSYENQIDFLENQRDDFDPRNYGKYFPSIQYHNDEMEKNYIKEMEKNKEHKVEIQ